MQRQVGFMRAHGMSNTGIRRALGLSEREAVEAGIIPSRADVKYRVSKSASADKKTIAVRVESDDGPASKPSGPLMAEVLAAVAQAGEVSSDEIVGASQGRRLMPLRQLTMYLLRELCVGASLPAIGYFLSRDHTTVHYGCRKAEQRLRSAPDFRALHDRVRDSLVPGVTYDV
ncbi:MAG: helix-turn-helix domain-containing protein [Alphaproteobacteria bacterium]